MPLMLCAVDYEMKHSRIERNTMTYLRELGLAITRRAHVDAATLIRRIAIFSVMCFLGLHPHMAMADCTFRAGYGLNVSTLVLPASLTVKRDTPVGTVIYDSGWVNGGVSDVWCSGGGTWTYGYASSMTPVPGMAHVYESGVPGIGIKAAYSNNPGDTPANINSVGSNGSSFMEWPRSSGPLSPVEYVPSGIYRAQFVMTGPIPVGTNTMSLPAPTSNTIYNSLETNRATFTATTFTVNSVGCIVNNSGNIVVNLDPASQDQFTTVGYTTNPKDFSINVSCPTSGTAVSYQIDDMGSSGLPVNMGVLANLATTGAASGVGVQVVKTDGTTIVPLSNKVSYITTTYDNQTVSIPLKGRYYQMTNTISPGNVVANATFTMFYQ